MRLGIRNREKKQVFASIISLLEPATEFVTFRFCPDPYFGGDDAYMHIHGIDRAHVCLYDCVLRADWFDWFAMTGAKIGDCGDGGDDDDDGADETESGSVGKAVPIVVSVSTKLFKTILGLCGDEHALVIVVDDDSNEENMRINFKRVEDEDVTDGNYAVSFAAPLVNCDSLLMNVDGDFVSQADFTLSSARMVKVMSFLTSMGGDTVSFNFSESRIAVFSKGMNGMVVSNIACEELTEYALALDEEGGEDGEDGEAGKMEQRLGLNVSFSLSYLQKYCFSKLAPTVSLRVGADKPMQINYSLGEGSFLRWFIAPKIRDEHEEMSLADF